MSLRRSITDDFGLRAKFKTKELGEVNRGTTEIVSDVEDVGDDGLDSVSFAFDFGLDGVHFVTVEDVVDVPADIDHSHVLLFFSLFLGRGLKGWSTDE